MNLKIISSKEIQYDWNRFNDMQNTYELHTINDSVKHPKYLLIEAWKWFCDWAERMHIDVSYYKYVEVTKWDCTWQIDFYDNEQCDTSYGYVSLYEIYYDSRNKKILVGRFAT